MDIVTTSALVREFTAVLNRKTKPAVPPEILKFLPGMSKKEETLISKESEVDYLDEDKEENLTTDYDLVEESLSENDLRDSEYLLKLNALADTLGISIKINNPCKQKSIPSLDEDQIRWEQEFEIFDEIILHVIGCELKQRGTVKDIAESLQKYGKAVTDHFENMSANHLQLLFWKTARAEVKPLFLT